MGSSVAASVTVGMKLAAVVWLCILPLAFVSTGPVTSSDLPPSAHNVSVNSTQDPQARPLLSTASLNQGRQRPLFARRRQYERQRIRVKPKVITRKGVPQSSKAAAKHPKPKCSQLTQSCLPQSGCCDASTACHCRFFNAICFCRRKTS